MSIPQMIRLAGIRAYIVIMRTKNLHYREKSRARNGCCLCHHLLDSRGSLLPGCHHKWSCTVGTSPICISSQYILEYRGYILTRCLHNFYRPVLAISLLDVFTSCIGMLEISSTWMSSQLLLYGLFSICVSSQLYWTGCLHNVYWTAKQPSTKNCCLIRGFFFESNFPTNISL